MNRAAPSADHWRRRLLLKIVLIGLGATLPLLASAIFFMATYANRDLDFTRRERAGIPCVETLVRLMAQVAEHRNAALGSAGGAPGPDTQIGEIESEIDRAFAEYAARGTKFDSRYPPRSSEREPSASMLAEPIRQEWMALERGYRQLGAAECVERHARIIGGLRGAVLALGDRSYLILDPESRSYRLAAAMVQALPTMDERRAAASASAATYLAHPGARTADDMRLALLAFQLDASLADGLAGALRAEGARDVPQSPGEPEGHRQQLASAADRFVSARRGLVEVVRGVLAGAGPEFIARELPPAVVSDRDAGNDFWHACAARLDFLLVERIDTLKADRNVSLSLIGLAFLSSVGLTAAVGRSIYRRTRIQQQAESEVRRLNSELETRVAERTAQLHKFARAIEQSPAIVMITDIQGDIEFVNPRFCEVTGYTAEEVIGRKPGHLIGSGRHPDAMFDELWVAVTEGNIWRGEVCHRKKNGELFWQQMSVAPLRDSAGAITHFVTVTEDVTDRIRTREVLIAAKAQAESANKAKSSFLANMSHEIRTPMNAILGFVQLMMRDTSLTPAQQEHLGVIGRNGEHLMELIQDILEMSKIEANRVTLNRAAFDLNGLVRDLESMFRARAEGKGLKLTVECEGDLPTHVVADEGKLRQIMINLLGNAVKFTEKGGITLRIRATPIEFNGWHLRAEVEDTGPGVPESEQDRLFQPFVQAELGKRTGVGTGLGLAISREFARMMDGDIALESREGGGSLFRVEVVLDRAEGHQPVAVRTPAARGRARLAPGQPAYRVLVADDMEDNRRFLCHILRDAGFEAGEAVNGAEAVAEFSRWDPHLILMDVRMPVMDGAEAIRRIRALEGDRRVKIVTLSASVFASNREQALSVGADDFLGKPFREADLFGKLGAMLGARFEPCEAPGQAAEPSAAPDRPGQATARVPADLLAPLRRAVEDADLDQMLALIEQVSASDPSMARQLRELAKRYDYTGLLALLEA